ncbi:MAG: VOC family protein [Bdellovibrionota bacterium]
MLKLSHIGIAVKDLPALMRLFSILGLDVTAVEDVPSEGVRTHFLSVKTLDSGGVIELLEPVEKDGPVMKFINKRGPGLHHLSFSVRSGELVRLCNKLASEGFRLVYKAPQPGAHGMNVNFIHPSSADGVLIELAEPMAAPGGR